MIAVVLPRPVTEQEQEEGDAGDRVERAVTPMIGPSATRAVGEQRERERDHEADRHRHDGQEDVLEQRVPVLVEVVGDPVRAEAVVAGAALGRALRGRRDLDLGEDRT